MSPDELEDLGRRFIDAFNQRDADALVAVADERIMFHPSPLVAARRTYYGHDGLRQWIAEIANAAAAFNVRPREIRALGPERLLVLAETWLGETHIADFALLANTHDDKIIEADTYLSNEQVLLERGLIPGSRPVRADTFELATTTHSGTVRITLRGELDIEGASRVREAVTEALAAAPSWMEIDLSHLSLIDSTGLRAMIAAHEACNDAHVPLRLIPGNQTVQRIFQLTHLDHQLPFIDTPPR